MARAFSGQGGCRNAPCAAVTQRHPCQRSIRKMLQVHVPLGHCCVCGVWGSKCRYGQGGGTQGLEPTLLTQMTPLSKCRFVTCQDHKPASTPRYTIFSLTSPKLNASYFPLVLEAATVPHVAACAVHAALSAQLAGGAYNASCLQFEANKIACCAHLTAI